MSYQDGMAALNLEMPPEFQEQNIQQRNTGTGKKSDGN